jgi:hypothetical protein
LQNGSIRFSVHSNLPEHQFLDAGLVADRWYYLAAVYDAAAKSVSCYVDGVLRGTFPYTLGFDAVITRPSRLGSLFLTEHRPLFGRLDEFRISTATRSPAWIKLNYETQKPGSQVVKVE